MNVTSSKVAPFAPIFAVEMIDEQGFAWLYGPLHLHEALKISAYFEREATPGREPRISIPPALLTLGLPKAGV
jgi:hypothetical protein